MTNLGHQRLLVRTARLYYEQNLTQSEIGDRLRLSRQKVQRLLQQARQLGVVRISIRPITGSFTELEEAIEERFGLREALIVETTAYQDQHTVAREVGAAAADYLVEIIQPEDAVVISWGGSLLGMINALATNYRPPLAPGARVIQGLGSLGDPTRDVHAADLARRLAHALGGQAVLMPAPAVAGTRQARDAMFADPFVQRALDSARSAQLAFMGIGAPRLDSILIREGQIVSWPELQDLKKRGAVGDINLRYFDAQGQIIESDLDRRVIGLTLDEIRRIPRVIGMAGGAAKVDAIRGALTGQLVDVLVTDHQTAEHILLSKPGNV